MGPLGVRRCLARPFRARGPRTALGDDLDSEKIFWIDIALPPAFVIDRSGMAPSVSWGGLGQARRDPRRTSLAPPAHVQLRPASPFKLCCLSLSRVSEPNSRRKAGS